MEPNSHSSDISDNSGSDTGVKHPAIDFRGQNIQMESTDYSNLIEGAEEMAQTIQPHHPDKDEKLALAYAAKAKKTSHDMTPPKNNNYMYMDESEGEEDYGYPSKEDYYAELAEGEIMIDDDSDYPPFGEVEDDKANAIDQLKKVFMHMKGEGSSPNKSKGSSKKEKKQTLVDTPKPKPAAKKSYREDEEKAPFTPL